MRRARGGRPEEGLGLSRHAEKRAIAYVGRLTIWWVVSWAVPVAAAPCPPEAAGAVSTGWVSYRTGDFTRARALFREGDQACPGNLDAKVGLGYVALRLGEPARAESLFQIVVGTDPANGDAWSGLAHAADQQSRAVEAIAPARRSWALHPGNPEIRDLLDRLLPGWERGSVVERSRPESLVVAARTHGDRFEVPSANGWRPFYVKGVNLGVALPGRFPAEFPADSLRYAGWIDTVSAMNANLLRVYTVLPPTFYRALAGWNAAHPEHALWLIHGVWTELPPHHDFEDPVWKSEFRNEMRRVVDLVHGAAEFPRRPGHAGGRYDADVSSWTLGYVIGREWEPFAVKAFDAARPGSHAYRGRLLEMSSGTATDAWMVEQCDFMLTDELVRYHSLRPIAYANWPTLDPLHHPTETNSGEETEWRRRFGAPATQWKPEYENDAVSLDPSLVRPTTANPAGWFASYHAYPYYPDFLIHDPTYGRARSSLGRSNYFGYLADLKRHHAGIPVLIAEYGVPSSRGVAHLQPQGWHHGGHDERAMGEVDARLTREIHESGMAGGILFALIDEWFKKNWTVIDLELPPERTRLWHNAMDPEQNYGVIAMVPGRPDGPRLGGDPRAWLTLPVLDSASQVPAGAPAAIHLGSDAGFLYLAIALPRFRGFSALWESIGVYVALDTYQAGLGQKALPGKLVRGDIGFEFLLDLKQPDGGTLRVTPEYNPYLGREILHRGDDRGRFYQRSVRPVNRADGLFAPLDLVTNRARYGRDGRFYPAQAHDRGQLRYGTEQLTSLADWYFDVAAGLLEVRLPWGLLNFTDPSSRTVVLGMGTGGGFLTTKTEGVRVGVVTYDKGAVPKVRGALPLLDRSGHWRASDFRTWTWKPWEEPEYYGRLKPAFAAMRDVWGSIDEESVVSVPSSAGADARVEDVGRGSPR
jgi:hypothetical protein